MDSCLWAGRSRFVQSALLRINAGWRPDVSKRAAVDGYVPGEQADSAVAILSSIKVGGQRPEQFAPGVPDGGELIVRTNRVA
jgi:hypothetical protein